MENKTMDCWVLPREVEFMSALAAGRKSLAIPSDIDWEKFEEYVTQGRVMPLIGNRLVQFPIDQIRQNPILEKMFASRNQYAIYSMKQMQTLAFVAKLFADAGIRMMSMKGPILAMELYGNPALRFSKDLDVFVAEEDYEKASALLEQHGFKEGESVLTKTPLRRQKFEESQEERHHAYEKDDVQIELHWRYSIHIKKTFDQLWAKRSEKFFMGQVINCFGQEDKLVYLICHAAGHGFSRLRWLYDIYEMQKHEDFSWEEIYKKAQESNVGSVILETMLMLYAIPTFDMKDTENELFKVSCQSGKIHISYDSSIHDDMKRGIGLTDAIYAKLFQHGWKYASGKRRYDYLMPLAGEKKSFLQFVARRFQPCATELELIDLPDSLYFLYYIIRPLYKIWQLLPFTKKVTETEH